jgi:capsule polysaccharide export protein KpsC/LpsZ
MSEQAQENKRSLVEANLDEFNANVSKALMMMSKQSQVLLEEGDAPDAASVVAVALAAALTAADLVTTLAVSVQNDAVIDLMLEDVMKDMKSRAHAGFDRFKEERATTKAESA